ncbi:MAG: lipoprotein signal peptidase [Gammaproteobacteria bacterium]|jgi:signal peptidase II|nr:lipoprotein signal peptidase [Gammaproteobacteria bacterium]MCH1550453.1 signal peptidase II [Pseudomonadales bacterium]
MRKWLLLAVGVFVTDQLSKFWVVSVLDYLDRVQVLPFFAWVRWHNSGAAFSFLDDAGGWQRWFFVCLALGFAAFVVYELSRLPKHDKTMGWVYGLILGGALGNMIDRLSHGHVIDFILFHYKGYYFPAFNVADSALFCGAVIWIYAMIVEYRQTKASSQ